LEKKIKITQITIIIIYLLFVQITAAATLKDCLASLKKNLESLVLGLKSPSFSQQKSLHSNNKNSPQNSNGSMKNSQSQLKKNNENNVLQLSIDESDNLQLSEDLYKIFSYSDKNISDYISQFDLAIIDNNSKKLSTLIKLAFDPSKNHFKFSKKIFSILLERALFLTVKNNNKECQNIIMNDKIVPPEIISRILNTPILVHNLGMHGINKYKDTFESFPVRAVTPAWYYVLTNKEDNVLFENEMLSNLPNFNNIFSKSPHFIENLQWLKGAFSYKFSAKMTIKKIKTLSNNNVKNETIEKDRYNKKFSLQDKEAQQMILETEKNIYSLIGKNFYNPITNRAYFDSVDPDSNTTKNQLKKIDEYEWDRKIFSDSLYLEFFHTVYDLNSSREDFFFDNMELLKMDINFIPNEGYRGNNFLLWKIEEKKPPVQSLPKLLKKGSDCTIINNEGNTIIHIILKNYSYLALQKFLRLLFGNNNAISKIFEQKLKEKLLKKENIDNDTPIIIAAKKNNISLLNYLLQLNKEILNYSNLNGDYALDCVNMEEKRYIDINNVQQECGESLLNLNHPVCKFLKDYGCPSNPDKDPIKKIMQQKRLLLGDLPPSTGAIEIDKNPDDIKKLGIQNFFQQYKFIVEAIKNNNKLPKINFPVACDVGGPTRTLMSIVSTIIFENPIFENLHEFKLVDGKGFGVSQVEFDNIDLMKKSVLAKKTTASIMQNMTSNERIFIDFLSNNIAPLTAIDGSFLNKIKNDFNKNSDTKEVLKQNISNIKSQDLANIKMEIFKNQLKDCKDNNQNHLQETLKDCYKIIGRFMFYSIMDERTPFGVPFNPLLINLIINKDMTLNEMLDFLDAFKEERGSVPDFVKTIEGYLKDRSPNKPTLCNYFIQNALLNVVPPIEEFIIQEPGKKAYANLLSYANSKDTEEASISIRRTFIADELLDALYEGFCVEALNLQKDFESLDLTNKMKINSIWPFNINAENIILQFEGEEMASQLGTLYIQALKDWINENNKNNEKLRNFVQEFSGSCFLLGKKKFTFKFVNTLSDSVFLNVHTCFFSADVSLKNLERRYTNSQKNAPTFIKNLKEQFDLLGVSQDFQRV
jgi:predicted small secreted protein